jgi:hypothetical protein
MRTGSAITTESSAEYRAYDQRPSTLEPGRPRAESQACRVDVIVLCYTRLSTRSQLMAGVQPWMGGSGVGDLLARSSIARENARGVERRSIGFLNHELRKDIRMLIQERGTLL